MSYAVTLLNGRVVDLYHASSAPADAVPVRTLLCDPLTIRSHAYLAFDLASGALSYDAAADALDVAWSALRAERNRRLSASDIRILPDRWAAMSDTSRAEWTAYRQALRDLPSIIADPTEPVDWPVPPT